MEAKAIQKCVNARAISTSELKWILHTTETNSKNTVLLFEIILMQCSILPIMVTTAIGSLVSFSNLMMMSYASLLPYEN